MAKEKYDLVLCSLMAGNKIKQEGKDTKKRVIFINDVKKPMEAGMLCMINGETLFSFMKNTWIVDSGDNDTGLYDINNINELIQDR